MNISGYACSSCALSTIAALGSSVNAEQAMKQFVSTELGTNTVPFYVFVAGPEVKGKGHSKEWVKYGTEFAKYIVDNGLGLVQTLGPIINKKYHPDTTCQVWIWQPDADALRKWKRDLGTKTVEPDFKISLRPRRKAPTKKEAA